MARNHPALSPTCAADSLGALSTAVSLAYARGVNLWTALYLDSPDEDAVEVTLLAAGLPPH